MGGYILSACVCALLAGTCACEDAKSPYHHARFLSLKTGSHEDSKAARHRRLDETSLLQTASGKTARRAPDVDTYEVDDSDDDEDVAFQQQQQITTKRLESDAQDGKKNDDSDDKESSVQTGNSDNDSEDDSSEDAAETKPSSEDAAETKLRPKEEVRASPKPVQKVSNVSHLPPKDAARQESSVKLHQQRHRQSPEAEKLAANRARQAKIKEELQWLKSTSESENSDIKNHASKVSYETQSPALGSMLSGMWSEMRQFEVPGHAKSLLEELKALEAEENRLKASGPDGGESTSEEVPDSSSSNQTETSQDEFDLVGQGTDVAQKAQHMSITDIFTGDAQIIRKHLLPGKKPSMRHAPVELFFALCSVIWFVVYQKQFFTTYHATEEDDMNAKKKYQNGIGRKETSSFAESASMDQLEDEDQIESRKFQEELPPLLAERHQATNTGLYKMSCISRPDVVFVFRRPYYDDSEENQFISKEKLRHLVLDGHRKHTFKNLTNLRDGSVGDVPLEKARIALLQDMCVILPECGFDLEGWLSQDGDELHVVVALNHEEAIKHMLQKNQVMLQLRKKVITDTLGIELVDDKHFAPPYVRYECHLAKHVLGTKDEDLYKTFGKGKKGPDDPGTIAPGEQRIKLILDWFRKYLDLDACMQEGIVIKWFPAHSSGKVKHLKQKWANWGLIKDLSFFQPIPSLKVYFGAHLAFMFAWNGSYCKLLLGLCVPAFFCIFNNEWGEQTNDTLLWNPGSVLGMSIVITVWARFASNLWNRQQHSMILNWDLEKMQHGKTTLPTFVGELHKSPIDGKKKELYYPRRKANLRKLAAWLATLSFCALSGFTTLVWMSTFYGKEAKVSRVASIVQALIIQLFTVLYNPLVLKLTHFENHKYYEDFYDSYLMKMLIFQFINQYFGFFFIAIKLQHTEYGCGYEGDCVTVMRKNLRTTITLLALIRIAQVIFQTLRVDIELAWERRKIIKAGGKPRSVHVVEEQTKYGEFRIREQVEGMTCLVLTLGYVLLFGSSTPAVVPLCFMVFVVQLRACAILVTTAANRPPAKMVLGIGPWQSVVDFLEFIGVVFTAYLFVQFSSMFQGTTVLTRLTCFVFYIGFLRCLVFLVDLGVHRETGNAELVDQRRHYILQKLFEKEQEVLVEAATDGTMSKASLIESHEDRKQVTVDEAFTKAVLAGLWEDVPMCTPGDDDASTRLDWMHKHGVLSPMASPEQPYRATRAVTT
jgi:hypothetical protein